jgi:Carboxypeptidase regulatory-like domain
MRVRSVWIIVVAVAFIGLLTGTAHAQSQIGGVVKDASGAVIPGVTVEAASPALIEKVRTVVSDDRGVYLIVDLRPGTYTVTFTLEGFQTFKRESLELPSNFTATVNAEMKVGALEESVTVSGSSPVVDVQTTANPQVLNREVLDRTG